MKFIIIFTILIGASQISSCTSDHESYKSNDALIDYKNEFIMNDGEQATPYYTNHKNFIKPYFKTTYQKDTLIVTTLMEINSCGKSVGDIRISNDTLYLMTKNLEKSIPNKYKCLKGLSEGRKPKQVVGMWD